MRFNSVFVATTAVIASLASAAPVNNAGFTLAKRHIDFSKLGPKEFDIEIKAIDRVLESQLVAATPLANEVLQALQIYKAGVENAKNAVHSIAVIGNKYNIDPNAPVTRPVNIENMPVEVQDIYYQLVAGRTLNTPLVTPPPSPRLGGLGNQIPSSIDETQLNSVSEDLSQLDINEVDAELDEGAAWAAEGIENGLRNLGTHIG